MSTLNEREDRSILPSFESLADGRIKVDRKGRYKLTKDLWVRNSCSCGTLPTGAIINVTAINKDYRQVYAEILKEWTFWYLPVVPVELERMEDQ